MKETVDAMQILKPTPIVWERETKLKLVITCSKRRINAFFKSLGIWSLLPSLYTPQVAWKKYSIHWVCPWGKVSSQGAIP